MLPHMLNLCIQVFYLTCHACRLTIMWHGACSPPEATRELSYPSQMHRRQAHLLFRPGAQRGARGRAVALRVLFGSRVRPAAICARRHWVRIADHISRMPQPCKLSLSTRYSCVHVAAHDLVLHAPRLLLLILCRVVDIAASSPPASPARDSETPEVDSAPLPSASSPKAPGSSGSPAGSRDSAVAAGDAQRRAAAAAEAAADAVAEDGSSAEDSAAAAGAAPAAKRQEAGRQQEVGQRLARTSSDNVSADARGAKDSVQLSGVVDN
jgi:hypothetical protein